MECDLYLSIDFYWEDSHISIDFTFYYYCNFNWEFLFQEL